MADRGEKHGDLRASDKLATMNDIKARIHRRLLGLLDLSEAQQLSADSLQQEISMKIDTLLGEEKYPLSGPEKQQLHTEVMDEIFGLGPLEPLLRDPLVNDILVNSRLLELDAMTSDMAFFLEPCVQCRMNMLISGGTAGSISCRC